VKKYVLIALAAGFVLVASMQAEASAPKAVAQEKTQIASPSQSESLDEQQNAAEEDTAEDNVPEPTLEAKPSNATDASDAETQGSEE
jgi:hypothetical protein